MVRAQIVVGVGLVVALLPGVGTVTPTAAAAGVAPMPLVLSAPATPIGDLFPGGTGTAQFTVDNPNGYPARLESLSFGTVRSSAPAGCPADLLSTHPVSLPSGDVVRAGAVGEVYRVQGAFTLAARAPDGCQGVTFLVDTTVLASVDGHQVGTSPGNGADTGNGGGMGAARPSTPAVLAWTGSPVLAVLVLGVALIIVGILLSLIAALFRRRRAQQARNQSMDRRTP